MEKKSSISGNALKVVVEEPYFTKMELFLCKVASIFSAVHGQLPETMQLILCVDEANFFFMLAGLSSISYIPNLTAPGTPIGAISVKYINE
jgi:hypothetical protein